MDKPLFSGCGGCTAKLGADMLEKVLNGLPKKADERLLVGFEGQDDAAVYRLRDDLALIQTLDFFPPVVDDPYSFGKIAAANALSDVYAMGGDVLLALNIAAFDEKKPTALLGEMLRGGAEKVMEAGGLLAGGHTIHDPVPKYGLSVTGLCHPEKIWRNNTPRDGDLLLLTKPLGVGIITTAQKLGEASPGAFAAAAQSMEQLNRAASEALRDFRVHACTDVTGFGCIGHLLEMLGGEKGGWAAEIRLEQVPFLPEADAYAKEFFLTAAAQRNRNHAKGLLDAGNASFAQQELLFDPQTSGGLLASLHPEDAEEALAALRRRHPTAAIIGKIKKRTEFAISLR